MGICPTFGNEKSSQEDKLCREMINELKKKKVKKMIKISQKI